MGDQWTEVRKPDNVQTQVVKSLVSFRKNSIAFNACFVKLAELRKYEFVTLYISPSTYKLGFRFHNDKEAANPFRLMSGKSVQVTRLLRQNHWLRAVADLEDSRLKRFEPRKNPDGFWEIQVCPAFDQTAKDKSSIPAEVRGIYRYRRSGEVVYIGRGAIRDRANAPERQSWEYDRIEYSVIDDEAEQARWETHWLDAFQDEFGRLPLFNFVSGKRPD